METDGEGKKASKLSKKKKATEDSSMDDKTDEKEDDSSMDSSMDEIKMMEQTDNVFQQLLGLPEVSIETLYL